MICRAFKVGISGEPELQERGSKLLRCGAKRQVAAFAGTRVYLLSLIDHLRKYPALKVQGF